jgi:hypothetical protein
MMKAQENAPPSLSHEDEQILVNTPTHSTEVTPGEDVIKYIAGRVPPDSVYQELVFFLKRGQITFNVIELEGQKYFFRKTTGKHDIRYFDTCDSTGSLPAFKIHITEAYFDIHLKDNIEAQAMLLLELYVEKVLVSPRTETRHQFAVQKAKALCDPSRRGLYLDPQRQNSLDNAIREQDLKYLFDTIHRYDIRRDPDRVYLQAIYEAIGNFKTINITTGTELLAWYRYMLESGIRIAEGWRVEEVVPRITDLIKESATRGGARLGATEVKIERSLIYKSLTTGSSTEAPQYDERFLFPFNPANPDDDHEGSAVLIPQCPVALSEKIFDQVCVTAPLDSVLGQDLSEFTEGIQRQAADENALSDIEGALNNAELMAARRIIGAAEDRRKRMGGGDRRGVVIAILAPACAGKTTFAKILTFGSQARGWRAGYWGCDGRDSLHPGLGFRYDVGQDGYRDTRIWGPGIYDAAKIRRALHHLRRGGALTRPADQHGKIGSNELGPDLDIIVTDGVFIGLDKELLDIIDILVCLDWDRQTDKTRLKLKWKRDTSPAGTHARIHLTLDFAEKQFHEAKDGMATLIPERADFVWVKEQRELYVRKDCPGEKTS